MSLGNLNKKPRINIHKFCKDKSDAGAGLFNVIVFGIINTYILSYTIPIYWGIILSGCIGMGGYIYGLWSHNIMVRDEVEKAGFVVGTWFIRPKS